MSSQEEWEGEGPPLWTGGRMIGTKTWSGPLGAAARRTSGLLSLAVVLRAGVAH